MGRAHCGVEEIPRGSKRVSSAARLRDFCLPYRAPSRLFTSRLLGKLRMKGCFFLLASSAWIDIFSSQKEDYRNECYHAESGAEAEILIIYIYTWYISSISCVIKQM